MEERQARDLIKCYVEGWKKNDLDKILSCTAQACFIIESHGPTYHGHEDLKKWFKFWLDAKSHIIKWDIESFLFSEKECAASSQWEFACVSHKIEYAFLGMSLFKFDSNKISFIQEYRMTRLPYQWKGDQLNSD